MIPSMAIRRVANVAIARGGRNSQRIRSITSSIINTTAAATATASTTFASQGGCSSTRVFSSNSTNVKAREQVTLVCPPNLKIDPNIISSPFKRVEKETIAAVASTESESDEDTGLNEKENESENNSMSKTTELSQDGNGNENENDINKDSDSDEEYDDEDEDEEYEMVPNNIEPVYVKALPERLHVPIIDIKSTEEVGTIHLSSTAFGQDPIRTDILHRCVVYLRNKKRGRRNAGARTKTISEVSGSGRKVRAQKGGGVARAGHGRPAHWRGGAKAHGPKGRIQNYETKLNKKVRKTGIKMALSQKLKEGNLILVNSFGELGTYKTKVLAQVLHDLAGVGGKEGTSGYIVDHAVDDLDGDKDDKEEQTLKSLDGVDINLKVASGNVFRTKVTNQQFVNVYDLLKHEKLIISLSALEKLEERY